MKVVNMHEAKSTLSQLIKRALAGDEVVIARSGKPLVRLVPLAAARPGRRLDGAADALSIGDNFDAPIADLSDYT